MQQHPLKNKWVPLALAAACLITSNSVFAEGDSKSIPQSTTQSSSASTVQTASVQQSEETLTLERAIEIARNSNHDLQMTKIDVKNANLNTTLVNRQADKIKVDSIESLDTAKQKYYNDAQADMTKKINQLELNATERKTKLEVEKKYYELVNANQTVQQQEQSLQRNQTNLSMVKTKLQAGKVSKIEVTQAEVSLVNAQASLEDARNQLKEAQLNLNMYLGVDLNTVWKLNEKTQQLSITLPTLDQATEAALKQRYEIEQAAQEVKLAELNVELYKKYSSIITYQGEMAVNNLEKAKANQENTKRSIIVEVTQAYNDVQSYQRSVDMYEKSKDLAIENYNAAKIRYENGMATSYDVVQAEEEVTKSENQYNSAVSNYNIAVVTLQNVMAQ